MAIAPEQLRSRLRSVSDGLVARSYDSEAVAILHETANHEWLAPSVVNADDALHSAIASAAAEWVNVVVDDELIPYEPGFHALDTQVLTLSVGEVPVLDNTLSLLEPPDPGIQFDINDVTLSRLRGFSYSVQFSDYGWVHFFRRLTRSNVELQPKKGLYAILVNNQYELAPERGLRLDTEFDALAIAGDLLVRRHQSFEKLFDFAELTVTHAEATASAVVGHLTIRGVDEFIRVVSTDRRMHSKLQSASEKMSDPGYRAMVTDATIAALVESRTDVDLEVISIDGSLELVFDGSPQRRWTLLKILDDDYLISELTASRYQAPSKHSGKN